MNRLFKSLLIWLALSPLFAFGLFPFAVMLLTALKPKSEMYTSSWVPSHWAWSNFIDMWGPTQLGGAVFNSFYVSLMATVLALIAAIPAGYAMSRYRFPGRGAIRQFLLISQMLSPIVLILGLFRVVVMLKLLDNRDAVAVIYAGFNVAFSVWMLESYFSTIPRDLEEAAWMEGASPIQSLLRVFLPLAVPAIIVTALFTFVNSWNEFVIALTVLRTEGNHTLPVQVLSLVSGRYSVEWNFVMASALVATIPVAVLFAWMQRYMVSGLTAGAVK